MLIRHNNFLNQCLKECLLTEPVYINIILFFILYIEIIQINSQNLYYNLTICCSKYKLVKPI